MTEHTDGMRNLPYADVQKRGIFKAVWTESGFGYLAQGPHSTYSRIQDFVNQLRDSFDTSGKQTFVRNLNDNHFGNPDLQYVRNEAAWTEVKRRLRLTGQMFNWW